MKPFGTIPKTHWYIGLLTILFLGQFLFISPIGNFALNDDWVHAETLQHWVNTGEFRLMPFAGPTFYIPILYGAALTKLFGFSFTTFRISTLILSFFLLLTLFFIIKRISDKPLLAFLCTLLVWSNPLFYNLSFSFMSDIPALFFITLGIWAYLRGFERKDTLYLFFGSFFTLLAAYTRQTGILLLAAAGLLALVQINDIGTKRVCIAFGIPACIGAGIYLTLMHYQLLPQSPDVHVFETTKDLLIYALHWFWYAAMYLGIICLPLTLPWFLGNSKARRNPDSWFVMIGITFIAILLFIIKHIHFPYANNYVSLYGIGPMEGVIEGQLIPWLSPQFIWIMSILSAIGTGLLGILFYTIRVRSHTTRLLLIFSVLYLIILLTFRGFDRYILPLIVAGVILVAERIKHISWQYSFTALCLLFLFFISITGTKHYLDWNRARWELADIPRSQNVAIKDIDAGFEWDGWYDYWDGLASNAWGYPPETDPWWIRKLYPNNSRQYIVSFSPLDQYNILEEKHIDGPNPNNTLYLLKRKQ